jgi:hypothetical protein
MTIGSHAGAGLVQIDRTTGFPTPWNPMAGSVRALAIDADTLYATGFFTSVAGRLAMGSWAWMRAVR